MTKSHLIVLGLPLLLVLGFSAGYKTGSEMKITRGVYCFTAEELIENNQDFVSLGKKEIGCIETTNEKLSWCNNYESETGQRYSLNYSCPACLPCVVGNKDCEYTSNDIANAMEEGRRACNANIKNYLTQ